LPKPATKKPTVVHIKVTLNDIRPAIWRRLRVPDSMNLRQLSQMIQVAMGWHGGHLHVFEIGALQYSDPSMFDEGEDEARMTVKKLMQEEISRFLYTYDFGDNWDHVVLIEKKTPSPDSPTAPACVAGARACPPEDCGGAPGYEELIAALAEPDRPESRELLEWTDEDFDPEGFSLEEADRRVKTFFGASRAQPR
jgi:hypothetical protein